MLSSIKMVNKNVKGWADLIVASFLNAANDLEHVDSIFNEAAGEGEGGSSGGASYFSPGVSQVVLAPYNFSFS
jgi:hypothetical protein